MNIRIPHRLWLNGKFRQLRFFNTESESFMYEFREICMEDCYQLELIKKHLDSVNNVIDIGANQGLFLVAVRNRLPDAKLMAYEPNPHLQEQLIFNGKSLGAQIYAEAVTKSDGTVNLTYGESDLHTVSKIDPTGHIPGIAFSKVIDRIGGVADIVKMDCEGAEWDLFEDVESWKKVNSITMEYHLWAKQGSTHDEVICILRKLGFYILLHKPLTDTFGLVNAIKLEFYKQRH